MTDTKKRFRVLVGINVVRDRETGRETRHEPGDVVDDLPESSIPSLLRQQVIEPVRPKSKNGGDA